MDFFDAWVFAENDATLALSRWRTAPSDLRADAHAGYAAALDREAKAADALRLAIS